MGLTTQHVKNISIKDKQKKKVFEMLSRTCCKWFHKARAKLCYSYFSSGPSCDMHQ